MLWTLFPERETEDKTAPLPEAVSSHVWVPWPGMLLRRVEAVRTPGHLVLDASITTAEATT